MKVGRKLLMAALLALGVQWAGASTPGVTSSEIQVGSVLPLEGGLAAGASQFRDGIKAYFSWVNDNGGINGRKVTWSAENDSYNPQQAVAAAKKLVDRDGVFALVGGLGTTNSLAMLPFLKQRGVPFIGPVASHPLLDDPVDMNIFPTLPLGPTQGSSLVEFADQTLHAKKIAVLYQDDQYGKQVLTGAQQYASAHGLEIVATASYVPSDVDMSPQALTLSNAHPDAVVMAVIPKQGALFMMEARKLGWKSQFLAPQLMADPIALQLAGSAIDGLYVNLYAAAESMNTPEVNLARQILAKYSPNTPVGYWAFEGMACAKIFTDAAKRAGPDLTRESLTTALESFGRYSSGYVPPVDYKPGKHLGPTTFGFARWEDGKVKVIKSWN